MRAARESSTLPAPGAAEAEIVSALARLEEGEVPVSPGEATGLVDFLAHASKQVRRRAAGALATAIRQGAIAAAACEARMEGDDPARRFGLAFALSRAGAASPRVVDAAVEALGAGDGDVRWAASSIVIAAARTDDGVVRRLRSLAQAGGPAARKMALACLADGGVRERTVFLRALGDPDPLVRIAALTALGRVGDRSAAALEALRKVADGDAEATVRRAASAILGRLGGAAT